MDRSFDLVDGKVYEADFFLEKLSDSEFNFFEARCYFSAFVASARSITFALQAVMTHVEGFQEWYAAKQEALKANPTARFFHRIRTESQHLGITPVNSGVGYVDDNGKNVILFYFSAGIGEAMPDMPTIDVVSACRVYLTLLVEIIAQCYEKFGITIDPDIYYTLENLGRLGISIEDVEESLGLPRGWTDIAPHQEQERLRLLRQSIPGTHIEGMFRKYLPKTNYQTDTG